MAYSYIGDFWHIDLGYCEYVINSKIYDTLCFTGLYN